MGRNVHNGVGLICDKRTNVKAFCIIFSINNIETMAKRFKTIKEVDLEEPRSGKGARCAPMQSVVQRPKPHVEEMIICGLLILLLMTGTYWRNRVWSSEVELWTDCVKKSPHKDRPHNNLGNALFYQGKYQEATNQYNEALRINRNFAEAHYNLGNVFSKQGRSQEAISHLNEALRINPNFAEAHYNLGKAYLMISDRGLALKEYEILKTLNRGLANDLYQEIK